MAKHNRNEVEKYLVETGDFYGRPDEELQMAVEAAMAVPTEGDKPACGEYTHIFNNAAPGDRCVCGEVTWRGTTPG